MTPKLVTPWARALHFHGEQFKVVECVQWEAFIGVAFGWGVGFSTFYLFDNNGGL